MFVGARSYIIVATTLALLCCTSAQQVNMNHVCALVRDGTYLGSDISCSYYYSCAGGIATLGSCGAGLYFSKDQQSCVPQSQVNCAAAGQNPCQFAAVGTWVSQPGTCGGFYYCSANGAQLSSCPHGENFDPTLQQCVYNSVYPCADTVNIGSGDSINGPTVVETVNLCIYVPNNVYFGSPSQCSVWNICNNNVMSSGSCPSGYDFNPSLMKCDYVSAVTCSQVSNDPQLNAGMASNGGTCSKIGLTKAVVNVCNYYYQCNGQYYQLVQCATGYYYDTVLETCVLRLNARNPCDRCAGVLTSFVNAYSSVNCRGYLYCSKGVQAGSGSCAVGMYFDEQLGGCTNGEEPDFGCCNPEYFTGGTGPSTAATDATTLAPAATTLAPAATDKTTAESSTALPAKSTTVLPTK